MSRKPKPTHWENLVTILGHFGVTVVLDIGAHRGEYGGYLRRAGWRGRIVSFEPQSAVRPALEERAAADGNWQVAPAMAIGGADGEIALNISAETDMSSALPLAGSAMRFTPSSAMVGRETVTLRRLVTVFGDYVRDDDTAFVKADTQGYESAVLDGAEPVMARIAGWQLELSIEPIYEGETDWRAMLDRMESLGYAAHLFIPGYFSRHIARQLQIDGVFMRRQAG
ncbi:MAG: FkbM family methyltransferase [Rhodospirillaceae bacterium]|nr:FkbM family methyltransferase [Rhodospirillaceae bacterium]MDE0617178.1 FkbM family methyltransferase [Rhodospirillaceae bacterium]